MYLPKFYYSNFQKMTQFDFVNTISQINNKPAKFAIPTHVKI